MAPKRRRLAGGDRILNVSLNGAEQDSEWLPRERAALRNCHCTAKVSDNKMVSPQLRFTSSTVLAGTRTK